VAQHKQTQITGTVWLLGEGRSNLSPGTKAHCTIFSPGPSTATLEFLEDVIQQARTWKVNLDINWAVVEHG
jgi:hypothetical protein